MEPPWALRVLKQDAFRIFAEGPLILRLEDQGLQFLRGAGQNNGVMSRGRSGEMRDGILCVRSDLPQPPVIELLQKESGVNFGDFEKTVGLNGGAGFTEHGEDAASFSGEDRVDVLLPVDLEQVRLEFLHLFRDRGLADGDKVGPIFRGLAFPDWAIGGWFSGGLDWSP